MASEPDTTEVREQRRFRLEVLDRYLCRSLPGFSMEPREVLTIRQYSSGQSNPTFYLKKGLKTYVLRKKPHGPLLPQAHKIDREYWIQKALFTAGFPVPEPLLYCSDASVIGTQFYMMQHVQGRIFRDITLPEVSPAERSALYIAIIETLAKLHSFKINSLGLQDYGRGAGYCKRQVSTWMSQYQAAAHIQIPAMIELFKWLMNNLPDDADNEISLIHGDFRIDNIIFDPREARIVAVLDWELSTLGHPLADLAYTLAFCFWPRALKPIKMLNLQNVNSIAGIPSPEELIMIYSRFRDTCTSPYNINFFLALSYFKLASISQGIYARYLLGNSSAENSLEFSNVVRPLAEAGLLVTKKITFSTGTLPCNPVELFQQSTEGKIILQKVKDFMKKHVFPAEKEIIEYYARKKNSPDIWRKPSVMERLKKNAKAEGLWNLFLPALSGLSQLDYALIAEETGKCFFAPEVMNCHAPDTGNMEILYLYGTEEQKKQWLEPLLEGKINSCFCMTEPDVASSDAVNMNCNIQRDGDNYIINGKKWWSSGAGNPNCKFAIVMGKDKNTSASKYKQHSMIIVPMDTPGVKLIRPLSVFGYFGEGRGFEIAQRRLGPGRIHHCMRSIGAGETALQILCERSAQRITFGKKLYHHEVVAHWIAECRIAIEQARLLILKAANKIDKMDNKAARKEIAMIKVVAPRAVLKVIDCAIQICGAAGFSDDFPLGQMFAYIRTLRVADGPDEVHLSAIAKLELLDQARKLNAHL
ncbi:acyl-CoA dehydrogenase family member 11 isoform X2 [Erythrolamprus reginae]|uniref:acyl-CoA dehydrogenase family member 11 isoform X2 n=1 Tax=Erythrolamprus reginae TaxID=121349 RepID=UPI00396CCFF8